MSTRYFLKELVNSTIRYADGEVVQFTHGAHDMGYLSLDSEADGARIKELLAYMKRRAGGVYEVDEARFENEKKKAPSSKLGSGSKAAPRLFNQSDDPWKQGADPSNAQSSQESAQRAGAPANVQAAVGASRAHVVTEPEKPDATKFKPRRGKRA
jgi:hypothetical protein